MAKSPKLSVSTAQSKANTTSARLDALMPSIASDLSPSLAYLPAADVEVGKNGTVLGENDYGWTAPDLNNGLPYTVQVEVFGAGGGGGGGTATTAGGGGGGGGEYACEPMYPVVPGETYSYFAGFGGNNGVSSQALTNGVNAIPGFNGQATCFDFRGKGIAGGVFANGGQGGDQGGPGVPGRGGTGSAATIHFDGGDGGTSASGIQSDNPILGNANGFSTTFMNYRLDDQAGATVAHDFSSNRTQSSNVTRGSGALVVPVSSPVAPPQIPFGPSANWWGGTSPGETQGNCWQFAHGSGAFFIGGIRVGNFTYSTLTGGFSVSAWVKGDPAAANAGDWTDGTHTGAVILSNRDVSIPSRPGFSFNLTQGTGAVSQLQLLLVKTDGTLQTIAGNGPSAADGNWHMVTATVNFSGNVILYVDGTAVTTTAATVSNAGGGTSVFIGYNGSTNSFGFKGFMSNVYLMSSVLTSGYISTAFGATAATGGSGGGASGGSAGDGNNGAGASGSAGGAGGPLTAASQPGINNGSGAGGNGGAANAAGNNGANVAPWGGGGGGAGAKSTAVPSEFQVKVSCSMSGSYNGLDAQGAAEGQLYTVSADPLASTANPWYSTAAKQDAICYTGGSADAPFKGSMNSLLTFPSLANVNANQGGGAVSYLSNTAAWTIQRLYLQLTVETANASNLIIGTWNSNAIVNAVDSDTTLTNGGYNGPDITVLIPAGTPGRQVTIDLSGTTIAATLISTAQGNGFTLAGRALQGAGLLLGTLTGSTLFQGNVHGAWNADEAIDWNCAFHGADTNSPASSAQLIITYTAAGASTVAAGDGAPGYIVISFIDPQGSPIATVIPAGMTDANGNVHGAGFNALSANYNVFQPNSNPTVLETWHVVTSLGSGWSWHGSGSLRPQYRMMPGNMVWLMGTVDAGATPATVLFTLPLGYRPSATTFINLWLPSGPTQNIHVEVHSDGTVNSSSLGGLNPATFTFNGIVSVDSISV